jgi:hypothetical protein
MEFRYLPWEFRYLPWEFCSGINGEFERFMKVKALHHHKKEKAIVSFALNIKNEI